MIVGTGALLIALGRRSETAAGAGGRPTVRVYKDAT